MAQQDAQRIGFIGLGAMGMGMARSLLRAGFDVAGYDVNPSAQATFADAGGRIVASAAEAAQDAEVLVIMVLNAAQADDVLFSPGGAAAVLQEPAGRALVILCSTVQPAYAERTAQRLAEMGINYLRRAR